MECLSPEEVSRWLHNFGQVEDPRNSETQPRHHTAFHAPANYNYQAVECFLECFLDQIIKSGELLVVVTDDEPSQPCQEFVNEAVRHFINERRTVSEAPGYRIDFADREKAIAIFSMMTCFGWKCYLYSDHDQIILYNWEGEVFDMWTCSEEKKIEIMAIVRNFGLNEIPDIQEA